MKKLMVFGCNGFVGAGLCLEALSRGIAVYGADTGEAATVNGIQYHKLDIADKDAVREAMLANAPDYAVNVAAIANIDFAEANNAIAYSVNVTGAANIALACAETNSRYIFFSSDAVFAGTRGGYTEADEKAPVNYYGKTKSEAEDIILALCKNAVIIRISLVLGFTKAGGNSFLTGLVKNLENNTPVLCPPREIRTPIDVRTLINCVLELCEIDYCGIMHLGSTNSMHRYAITCRAATLLGFSEDLIKKEAGSGTASNRAPRHQRGEISVQLAAKTLRTPLFDVEQTIDNAVALRKEL